MIDCEIEEEVFGREREQKVQWKNSHISGHDQEELRPPHTKQTDVRVWGGARLLLLMHPTLSRS